jgi:hypothetical protein
MADAGEIYIFTKNLIVHANDLVDADGKKLPPVAGEIDMIIVDRKGNKFIVDLKTGKLDKWFKYKVVGTLSYKKQLENTLQQTGYANLAENMSGMQFGIKIFPIEVGFDKKGYIVAAGKPTNPSLFAGEEIIGDEDTMPYTISLDKGNVIQTKNEETGAYETQSIDEFMQKLIPVKGRKASQVKTQPSQKDNIPEEERVIVDDFMSKMAEIGDTKKGNEAMDDLMEVALELDAMKPRLSKEAYNNIKTQLDARMSLTFDETGNIVLNIGEIYIFTEPVKDHKVVKGYRVKVDTFDPEAETVTVSRVGPGRKKTFTMNIQDFNESAMSEESINNMPKENEPYVPSEEELGHLTEGLDVVSDLLTDLDLQKSWLEESKNEDYSSVSDDFLNNLENC